MKRKPFWIISLLCIVFARSKTDEENFAKQEVFPVKVIQTICGETVLKILDEDFYHLGQTDWTWEEITHHHVFFTQLGCEDLENFNQMQRPSLIGSEFNVRIIQPDPGDCARCEATISNPPGIKHYVDVIF